MLLSLKIYEMAVEAKTSVDELFSIDDFGAHFEEWQRAKQAADDGENEFLDYITRSPRSNWTNTTLEADDLASYLRGLAPGVFEHIYRENTDLIAVHERITNAVAIEIAARDKFLAFSWSQGINPFALYGLSVHTTGPGVIPEANLYTATETAVRNFERIVTLVQDHQVRY